MPDSQKTIVIATRGSALALAQSSQAAAQFRALYPKHRFELKIIKTTGDKLQTEALAHPGEAPLPKGLFTKELEAALLRGQADIAVHSLKDLPTEIPAGLKLGAIPKRADMRDALIYRSQESAQLTAVASKADDWRPGQAQWRGFKPGIQLRELPTGATIATSSTRRRAQLLDFRPDLKVVDIRGNVPTRLRKLDEQPEIDALVLAAAGLERLGYRPFPDHHLRGDEVPDGQCIRFFELDEMLPCAGQGAIGIEIRDDDDVVTKLCERLNHPKTQLCVLAERAFLRAMGGGCQSPVGVCAEIIGHQVRIRAVVFDAGRIARVEGKQPMKQALALAEELALQAKGGGGPR